MDYLKDLSISTDDLGWHSESYKYPSAYEALLALFSFAGIFKGDSLQK